MEIVGIADSATATGVYLSDGTVSLALLTYRTDAPAGPRGKDFVGLHHFGFMCENLEEQSVQVEQAGATLFQDIPQGKAVGYYEKKYTDPNGIIFDITHSGWKGSRA